MSADDRDLQSFADELGRLRAVGAPAALRRDLRGALLAAPFAPQPHRRASWLGSLRPLLAAVIVLAVLVGTAGSAAAGSLPGDPAFVLKRVVEDAQVALSPSDESRLDLLVAQADRRLTDLETVAARHAAALTVASEEYVAALARLDRMIATVSAEPTTSSRAAALERAAAAAAAHLDRLRALADTLPAEAQPGIQRAIDAGARIRARDERQVPQPSARPSAQPSHPGGVPSAAPGASTDVRPGEPPHPTPPAPSHP